MYSVKEINPLTASKKELSNLFESVTKLMNEEGSSVPTYENWLGLVSDAKRNMVFFDFFMISKNDQIIGRMVFSQNESHDDVDFFLSIEKAHSTRDLVDFLAHEISPSRFPKKAFMMTYNPVVRSIGELLGFKLINQMQDFELELDGNTLIEWEKRNEFPVSIDENLSSELIIFPEGPFLAEWTEMINEGLRDMIRNNKRESLKVTMDGHEKWMKSLKNRKVDMIVLAIKNSAGKCIACSNALIQIDKPLILGQRMTAVTKEYRGHGLAITAKAQLYKAVKARYPGFQKVKTDCFVLNEPMIKSNLKMGFQKTTLKDELVREIA